MLHAWEPVYVHAHLYNEVSSDLCGLLFHHRGGYARLQHHLPQVSMQPLLIHHLPQTRHWKISTLSLGIRVYMYIRACAPNHQLLLL